MTDRACGHPSEGRGPRRSKEVNTMIRPRPDDAFDMDLLVDAVARDEAMDLAERPPPSADALLVNLLDPLLDDDEAI